MQTDFEIYSKPYIIGQHADCSLTQIDSHAAEADIKFGTAVMRGTNGEKQVLPSDGKEFIGVALRDDIQRKDFYSTKSMVSVMTKGRVAVITTEAVSAGDTAYIHTDGTFSNTREHGLEVGIFFSNQESENGLVILELQTVVHSPLATKKVNTKTPTNLLD